jgi:hypothetical protein
MASQLNQDQSKQIAEWIDEQAQKLKVSVTTYPDSIVRDNNWIHAPVTVNEGGDAYDRATWLQRIEDEWDPKTFDGYDLLLVPAKPSEPSTTNLYAHVGELMKRQHLLLERIDKDGEDSNEVERFQTIRREWEETLKEMEELYPSLAQSSA